MAVITYVDDRYSEREWKLAPSIAIRKTIDEYLEMPASGDVLIIHGGQRDGILLDPDSGRLLLLEAVVRVCAKGGRAIIFSGGQPMAGAQQLRDRLARESLVEGLHFLLLATIQNILHEVDFELLQQTKITPEWPIREVRRRYAAPMLLALGLLCQAALFAFDPEKLDAKTAELLGGRETAARIRRNCATSAQELLTRQAWLGALGPEGSSRLGESLEREWPAGAGNFDGVRALVRSLYDAQGELTQPLLSRAFRELHTALRINEDQQQ